jgi:GTPase SAR1 family protein
VTIAVLGAAGVGKSTFIRCALDLKQPASSPASVKKMSLDGVVYHVRLLEIGLGSIHITADQQVEWPETVMDQPMTQVDGALTLYDVMNKESLAHLPELISEFIKSKSFYEDLSRLSSIRLDCESQFVETYTNVPRFSSGKVADSA